MIYFLPAPISYNEGFSLLAFLAIARKLYELDWRDATRHTNLNSFILGHIACFYKICSFTRPIYITYIPHSDRSTGILGNLFKNGFGDISKKSLSTSVIGLAWPTSFTPTAAIAKLSGKGISQYVLISSFLPRRSGATERLCEEKSIGLLFCWSESLLMCYLHLNSVATLVATWQGENICFGFAWTIMRKPDCRKRQTGEVSLCLKWSRTTSNVFRKFSMGQLMENH